MLENGIVVTKIALALFVQGNHFSPMHKDRPTHGLAFNVGCKGIYTFDGKKSYEGTFSMFLASFLTVNVILLCRGGLTLLPCLIISLIVAAVAAATELYSKNGNDTIICPLSAMAFTTPEGRSILQPMQRP